MLLIHTFILGEINLGKKKNTGFIQYRFIYIHIYTDIYVFFTEKEIVLQHHWMQTYKWKKKHK